MPLPPPPSPRSLDGQERIDRLAALAEDDFCGGRATAGDFAWTTTGRVSGGCGHRHRTPEAAAECQVRHERDTWRQTRGSSRGDRRIIAVSL